MYTVCLQVPMGTSSHTKIRLANKGVKRLNSSGYGDHYVHLKIRIPQRLNDKQKALIQAYAELETDTPGTVDGIVNTRQGKTAMDDPSGLVRQIRTALDEPVVEPVEDQNNNKV
ncbi:dnaJ homolog subfamily A member 3, mitochondrial-like [Dermacentor silvarum]|uniref:dnaJ homolog subfamily A member 3, mitochondrial-like n=1 Tax=Dermacentor silvarum TaxID=543639 RepID=UPI00189ABC26|nr:dnaJ homolog subfamily A member 3, mitochondrial-like [Dermacentor silvarum]